MLEQQHIIWRKKEGAKRAPAACCEVQTTTVRRDAPQLLGLQQGDKEPRLVLSSVIGVTVRLRLHGYLIARLESHHA